jgi:hypothetical protein
VARAAGGAQGTVGDGPTDGAVAEPLEIVQALWAAKGYPVRREGWSVEVKDPGFTLRFVAGVNGCAEMRATMTDATDTTDDKLEGGFGQGPLNHAAQCATVDDPYWSH